MYFLVRFYVLISHFFLFLFCFCFFFCFVSFCLSCNIQVLFGHASHRHCTRSLSRSASLPFSSCPGLGPFPLLVLPLFLSSVSSAALLVAPSPAITGATVVTRRASMNSRVTSSCTMLAIPTSIIMAVPTMCAMLVWRYTSLAPVTLPQPQRQPPLNHLLHYQQHQLPARQ